MDELQIDMRQITGSSLVAIVLGLAGALVFYWFNGAPTVAPGHIVQQPPTRSTPYVEHTRHMAPVTHTRAKGRQKGGDGKTYTIDGVIVKGPYSISYAQDGIPDFDGDATGYYQRNWQAATNGDANAMYKLALVNRMCGNPDGRTPEDMLASEYKALSFAHDKFGMDEDIITALKQRFSDCMPVWRLMPKKKIDWWQRAYEAHAPVPVFDQVASKDYGVSLPHEALNHYLVDMAATGIPGAMDRIELAFQDRHRLMRDPAATIWRYVGCLYKSYCDPTIMEANIRNLFYEYQADEILARAKALKGMIDSGAIRHADVVALSSIGPESTD